MIMNRMAARIRESSQLHRKKIIKPRLAGFETTTTPHDEILLIRACMSKALNAGLRAAIS